MKFSGSSAVEEVDINLTPLIDVVFLLLIFFMVSTTFDTTSELKIVLPEASQNQSSTEPERLNLMIDPAGKFFLNARELSDTRAGTLKAALQGILEGRDLPIVIQSDAQSPVQSLVTAMDVVGQLGMTQVAIATTRPIE